MENEQEHMHEYEELQIISANGWRTCFYDTSNKKVITRPLVCFTLIQHIKEQCRFIDGFAPSLEDRRQIEPAGYEGADERYIWLGYLGIGETVEDFIAELKENGEFPDEL